MWAVYDLSYIKDDGHYVGSLEVTLTDAETDNDIDARNIRSKPHCDCWALLMRSTLMWNFALSKLRGMHSLLRVTLSDQTKSCSFASVRHAPAALISIWQPAFRHAPSHRW